MHSVYRTHIGNAQPTKKLINLIKKTARIRNTWLEKCQFKKHLFQNESRGSKLHIYKRITTHFYKAVFINYLVFLFSDRYRCLGPPVTAIFRKNAKCCILIVCFLL